MYRYLRNTHLLLGLFCCFFLLMYGLSAVQMAHNKWFNLQPAVTESRLALPPGAADARSVARTLMERKAVRGELNQVRALPARLAFNVVVPGTVYQVEYDPASGDTRLRENRAGFIGMLNRIHHVGGLWHEFTLTQIWGIFTGIVSLALIVIGGTGIYLWFKLHQERLIGAVLLAVSLSFSLTLIVMMRTV